MEVCVMELEKCNGVMVLNTLESGVMAKHMAKESSITVMVIIMKVIGATTKRVGLDYTCMRTAINTKGNGLKMFSTDMVKRGGLMAVHTKDHTFEALNTV